MKIKVSELVMNWKTIVSVVIAIFTGIIWLGTQMWDVKSYMTENRIEVIKEIGDLKTEQAQDISDLRNEIIQYHTMLGTLQQQFDKHEERAQNHQMNRTVHN